MNSGSMEVIKVVALGRSGLGKTHVIKKICNSLFNGDKTIGVEFESYVFDYKNDEIRQSTTNPLPFTVEVFRDASRSDVIDSRNIRVKDANGEEVGNGMSFKLKFQTISRKGHWRETGNLLVDTVGEHSVV